MHVTDPRALRAMAHPLRLDLIEFLGTSGPATAAECGRQLGSTQASCSYHLRQLARYGFVEQAEERVDSRERPWQLTDLEQRWSGAERSPATDELERVFVQREADRILAWHSESARQPEDWQDASFVGGATVPLTAEELLRVRDELRAVLEPYVARLADPAHRPDGHRFVRIMLAGTPAGTDPERTSS
ncbi:MAG TPA: helix-turn-helix domain-containing protein [Ornithinicoccus sp.]|nr:helix-turn-helix domain-containing protein [Ornithinicoccus sp.]